MATVEQTQLTPDDLLKIPDNERYELVDGELVETDMSMESAWVATQVTTSLNTSVRSKKLGLVMTDSATYQCFPDDPGKVRRPDASFVRVGRLSDDQFREGHCLIAPDLAVEVVSPNDRYFEVEHKVAEYLAAGVLVVWVLNPNERNMRVFTAAGDVRQLSENEELTCDDVIPGFRVRVGEFFPPADLSQLLRRQNGAERRPAQTESDQR